LEVNENETS